MVLCPRGNGCSRPGLVLSFAIGPWSQPLLAGTLLCDGSAGVALTAGDGTALTLILAGKGGPRMWRCLGRDSAMRRCSSIQIVNWSWQQRSQRTLLSPLNHSKGFRYRLRCCCQGRSGHTHSPHCREQIGFALKCADEALRRERRLVIEAVRQHGFALGDVDDSLRVDHDVVMAAVRRSGRALAHACQSSPWNKSSCPGCRS